MATAHPASSQAGTQPESNKEPKSQPETYPDRGIELETALPVAAPTMASDATSRVKQKKRAESKVPPEPTSENPETPLIIAGVDEASESSASHLGGSSAKDIKLVDTKFQKFLAT